MTTIKQPVLMDNFDVEKHPLSNAVWKELEKLYPDKTRLQIYQEHHGEIVPDENREVFQIKNGELKKKDAPPENAGFEQTELGIFLDKIYFVEVWEASLGKKKAFTGQANQSPPTSENYESNQVLAERAVFEKFIKVVNDMPDVEGINELKVDFLEKLNLLQNDDLQIGSYEMIIDEKPLLFENFKDFSKDFFNLTLPVLADGGVPNFDFYNVANKEFLAIYIAAAANMINEYWAKKEFSPENFGIIINLVYTTAKCYEDGYYPLFNKWIQKAQKFERSSSELRIELMQAMHKLKKELIDDGETNTAANVVVRRYFKKITKSEEITKKWKRSTWKKNLQID